MSAAYLLDTHALLWWLSGDGKLPATIRRLIGRDDSHIYVSAASAWEIATKVRLGKLPGAAAVLSDLEGELIRQKFQPLSISFEHAVLAGSFGFSHRDPFDRMIAAQALKERLPVLSGDEALDQFGIERRWR